MRTIITLVLSLFIMISSALFTGCTEEEADKWLNEIFGMLNYEVYGDAIEGEANLKMHVIDVGQGDSILMQCGECNVLIDCGENGMGDTVLEYLHRAEEQKRLIESMPVKNSVGFIEGDYASDEFYKLSRGLENAPEGGERCRQCFELRLRKTAELAAAESFDYFTTTLTISPLKNAQLINETGKALAEKYGVEYLFSDFKKKEGYKRSIELSREYGLYRQNYCGCIFSKKENV